MPRSCFTGDLGTKVSVQTMFQENQAVLVPCTCISTGTTTGAVSGQGRVKFKEQRMSTIGWSQGNVSPTRPARG